LLQARIRDVFACEYNPNITNITIGWKRCILRKVTKSLWEILDKSGTELLEEVENDEDNGPIAEWGLWYRNPSEKSIDEAKKVVVSNVVGLDDVELMESPGRKKRRDDKRCLTYA